MKRARNVLYSMGISAVILTAVATSSLGAAAEERVSQPVTPALSVIAEDNGMAMAGLIGTSISFDEDDFARALNLSEVETITITEAPPIADGELRVGTTVVNSGQTISASSLSLMSYTASNPSSTRTSFRFCVNGSGYDIPCELYLLDKYNHSPTLDTVPQTTLEVSTHRNIIYYGELPCFDSDGDDTIIEIVSYPQSGSLLLTDKATGEYTYTPTAGYSGKDSFTYVARDIYGNYSASATVTLTVSKPTTTVSFDDMDGSRYYNAALTMVEEGIMSGTQVGADTYFYPDGTVSRGEFVVMALHAIGMTDVADVSTTVFADDSDIPVHMKGYIDTAYKLGYVRGTQTESGLCFNADDSITRAEAAVILGNILDIATPTVLPTFSDSAELPAWAAPSMYTLNSVGVMNTVSGNISPKASVTRADAAQILTNLMRYLDK